MLYKQPNVWRRCGVFLACAFVLTAMLGSVPAQATPTTTRFFWDSISGDNELFFLPTMPTPDLNEDGISFLISDVPVLRNGTGPFLTDTAFYTEDIDGGGGFSNAFANAYGPQVFSGPTGSPTFVNGDYEMFESPDGALIGTLHIATVPEPASLALVGTVLIGFVGMRKVGRRKRVS